MAGTGVGYARLPNGGPRRRSSALVGLVAIALLVLAACGSGHPPVARPAAGTARGPGQPASLAAGRPNIVVVLADDLTADLIRFMPHVRGLQRAGTQLSSYIVSDSLCCPSRASILTGRYPHSTGVWANDGPHGGYRAFLPEQRDTFATRLHAAGYRTGLIGKYLNGYHVGSSAAAMSPVPPGWDRWFVSGGSAYDQFDYTVNDNGRLRVYGHRPSDDNTDVLARQAGSFIRDAANSSRPFLLEVAPFSPHLPAVPSGRHARDLPLVRAPRDAAFDHAVGGAPPWLANDRSMDPGAVARVDRIYRNRARSAEGVDELVATVQRAIAAAGVERNTYLVVTSDNGFHLGQHQLLPGKRTAFDTDVRVPLIVSGPRVPAGRRVTALASNVDLAPTFLAIGGVPVPHRVEGRSLLGWWHGRPPAEWRDAVLVDYLASALYPGDPDRQVVAAGRPSAYQALRRTDSLYVGYLDGQREFYDMRRDPLQLVNAVAGLDLAARAGLEQQLGALGHCSDGPSCHVADTSGTLRLTGPGPGSPTASTAPPSP